MVDKWANHAAVHLQYSPFLRIRIAATTSVGLYCRGETTRLEPAPGLVGDWLAAANCDPGTAICGYRQQVEAQNAFGDDSALNEVDFACCPSM